MNPQRPRLIKQSLGIQLCSLGRTRAKPCTHANAERGSMGHVLTEDEFVPVSPGETRKVSSVYVAVGNWGEKRWARLRWD